MPAASTEPPCDASCSGVLGSSAAGQAPAAGSSAGDTVASSPLERSPPEGMEDTSGGCRRAEPTAEEGQGGEEGQSQPARVNQDSDDSDDDPILIPSTRFRGQGQRYVRQLFIHTSKKNTLVYLNAGYDLLAYEIALV